MKRALGALGVFTVLALAQPAFASDRTEVPCGQEQQCVPEGAIQHPNLYTGPPPTVVPAPIVTTTVPTQVPLAKTGADLAPLVVIGASAIGTGFALKRRRK